MILEARIVYYLEIFPGLAGNRITIHSRAVLVIENGRHGEGLFRGIAQLYDPMGFRRVGRRFVQLKVCKGLKLLRGVGVNGQPPVFN